jgi:hypothetical protein
VSTGKHGGFLEVMLGDAASIEAGEGELLLADCAVEKRGAHDLSLSESSLDVLPDCEQGLASRGGVEVAHLGNLVSSCFPETMELSR